MRKMEHNQNSGLDFGYQLCRCGLYQDAMMEFRKAIKVENKPDIQEVNPVLLSFYSFAMAHATLDFKEAIKLSRIAMNRGKQFPCTYLNMGKIYESSGNRKKAINTYRKGYREHSDNAVLLSSLQRLSPRARIFCPYLDRDHVLNKFAAAFFRCECVKKVKAVFKQTWDRIMRSMSSLWFTRYWT